MHLGWNRRKSYQMLTFGIKIIIMLILGIAGGTGCGKTTVVNQIVDQLPENEVCVISQDSYYNDLSHLTKEERGKINFDHPNSIDFDLLISHLGQLRQGKPINRPIYSFVEENRLPRVISMEAPPSPAIRTNDAASVRASSISCSITDFNTAVAVVFARASKSFRAWLRNTAISFRKRLLSFSDSSSGPSRWVSSARRSSRPWEATAR